MSGILSALVGAKAAPQFVAYAASTTSGSATSLVIPKPTGVAQGDLLVAVMSGGAVTWTGDTSWSERIDQGADPSLRVATLEAGGSEPASYTFTASSSAVVVGQILAFRFATYDTIGSIATITGDGDLVMSQITMIGGFLVAGVVSNGQPSRTHTTPAGMTLTEQKFNDSSSISCFYQVLAGGATGSRTSTMAGGGGGNAGVLASIY